MRTAQPSGVSVTGWCHPCRMCEWQTSVVLIRNRRSEILLVQQTTAIDSSDCPAGRSRMVKIRPPPRSANCARKRDCSRQPSCPSASTTSPIQELERSIEPTHSRPVMPQTSCRSTCPTRSPQSVGSHRITCRNHLLHLRQQSCRKSSSHGRNFESRCPARGSLPGNRIPLAKQTDQLRAAFGPRSSVVRKGSVTGQWRAIVLMPGDHAATSPHRAVCGQSITGQRCPSRRHP